MKPASEVAREWLDVTKEWARVSASDLNTVGQVETLAALIESARTEGAKGGINALRREATIRLRGFGKTSGRSMASEVAMIALDLGNHVESDGIAALEDGNK